MNVLLVVPYNVFEAKHGNAIRVKALVDTLLKDGNRISLLMYDLPWTNKIGKIDNAKVYFRAVKLRIIAIAALMRILFKAPAYDLLCAKMEPFGGFKKLIERIIREDGIDVVQCENIWTVPPLASVIGARVPIVVTSHDVWTDRFEQLYKYQGVPEFVSGRLLRSIRKVEAKALLSCGFCVCVSEEDRRKLIEMGAEPSKTWVVPNGVDVSKVEPAGKDPSLAKELGIGCNDAVLLFAGSEMFQNKKAAEDILEKILPKLDGRFKIVFAGTICKYLAKLDLPECAILAGYRESLAPLYGLADVVVIPITIGSGTKLKTLEAMAAGKPIVTTPMGAIGLNLNKRANCLWIEERVESFPSAIEELFQEKDLRLDMGRKAREKALEYDWGILMKRYLDIYKFVKNSVLWEDEASFGGLSSKEPPEKALIATKLLFHFPRRCDRPGKNGREANWKEITCQI